jgi:hypothetical protein
MPHWLVGGLLIWWFSFNLLCCYAAVQVADAKSRDGFLWGSAVFFWGVFAHAVLHILPVSESASEPATTAAAWPEPAPSVDDPDALDSQHLRMPGRYCATAVRIALYGFMSSRR